MKIVDTFFLRRRNIDIGSHPRGFWVSIQLLHLLHSDPEIYQLRIHHFKVLLKSILHDQHSMLASLLQSGGDSSIKRCYDLIYHGHFKKKVFRYSSIQISIESFTLRYLDTFVDVVSVHFHGSHRECKPTPITLTDRTSTKLEGFGGDPRVVVASSINPRIVGGIVLAQILNQQFLRLTITNSLAFGRLFFNGKCLMIPTWNNPAPSLLRGYAKVEPLSISKLNKFVLTAKPQVTGIKMERGRCYVSCFMYTRKLQRTVISFTFVSRNNTKAIGVLRYRVEMSIS
ncbi:hypothetical protein HID58_070942 [Brassica napus]|uniref:Uncharacterized protein n=1 Tax=Brassica napus TaxID=3708 RepID=A0ABQ7Z0A3_BRANA|nr:hypothetical protein HID58_070942 [Brassica napus]